MQEYLPGCGIFTVDSLYYQAELASIHLIRSGDRIAIIDTGTQFSVPQVQAGLQQLGLEFANVDFVILTHIHLDHAGGAGSLMQLCKHAKLVVHPKGARHMVSPEKLIAGSTAVYGEEEFARLYGKILAIDEARIIEPTDGERIDFNGRQLIFIDTPGHANHHHCIIDPQTHSIFTGDTLGVGYRSLRNEQHAYLSPTTTPIQFNPDALHQSIDKVMSYDPAQLYLTHYSQVTPSSRIIAGLHEQIDDFVALTEQASQNDDNFERALSKSIEDYMVRRCLNEIPEVDEALARQWLSLDAALNAQGLIFWWQHRRAT